MHNMNWGSRTSHLLQSRQSRSVEAEFQIFGSLGKGEMRKWTYPYLEVLTEQVWKMNEIFRVLAERKYGERNFRSLAVKAAQKCGSATSHLWKSRQRRNAEVDLSILGGPELFCLLLGPPGFNCWFPFAPVFQWCCWTPQGSPGVGRNTFLSSPHLCFIILFICDLFVSRDDPLMS